MTRVYRRVDGHDLHLDIYVPAGSGPFPVVVWIHGGALILGSRAGVRPLYVELLREAGLALVSIDYRLAPETKLAGIVEDVLAAFAWVREEGPRAFGADGERLAAMGVSGGGYLALVAAQRVRPRLRAAVSYFGYGDIVGTWYALPDPFYTRYHAPVSEREAFAAVGTAPISVGGRERGRFYLYCRQRGIWPREVGGASSEALAAYCPERAVDPSFPPTLLAHGTADTDVPYACSVDMTVALRRAGVAYEFHTIPDGAHGFDREVTRPDLAGEDPAARAVARTIAFLRHHLAA